MKTAISRRRGAFIGITFSAALSCVVLVGCHKHTSTAQPDDRYTRDSEGNQERQDDSTTYRYPWEKEGERVVVEDENDTSAKSEQVRRDAALKPFDYPAGNDEQPDASAKLDGGKGVPLIPAGGDQAPSDPSAAESTAPTKTATSKSASPQMPDRLSLPTRVPEHDVPLFKVEPLRRAHNAPDVRTHEAESAPDAAPKDPAPTPPIEEKVPAKESEKPQPPASDSDSDIKETPPGADKTPAVEPTQPEVETADVRPANAPVAASAWGRTLGDHALFLIDASADMSADDLRLVCDEIRNALDLTASSAKLSLLAMQGGQVTRWREEPAALTIANRQDAQRWLDRLTNSGTRDLSKGIDQASKLAGEECDSFFVLLSAAGPADAEATESAAESESIAETIAASYTTLKVIGCDFHALVWGDSESDAAKQLASVSEECDGSFDSFTPSGDSTNE